MFRDRLQLGPEEKQVIDGLAFLARTVNGVRMEMDLLLRMSNCCLEISREKQREYIRNAMYASLVDG